MGNEKIRILFLRFSSLGDVILANFNAKKIKQKNPDRLVGFHFLFFSASETESKDFQHCTE